VTYFVYFSEYFSEATKRNDKVPQNNLYWGLYFELRLLKTNKSKG